MGFQVFYPESHFIAISSNKKQLEVKKMKRHIDIYPTVAYIKVIKIA